MIDFCRRPGSRTAPKPRPSRCRCGPAQIDGCALRSATSSRVCRCARGEVVEGHLRAGLPSRMRTMVPPAKVGALIAAASGVWTCRRTLRGSARGHALFFGGLRGGESRCQDHAEDEKRTGLRALYMVVILTCARIVSRIFINFHRQAVYFVSAARKGGGGGVFSLSPLGRGQFAGTRIMMRYLAVFACKRKLLQLRLVKGAALDSAHSGRAVRAHPSEGEPLAPWLPGEAFPY